MHLIAKTNNKLLVKNFIELGANINSFDYMQRTPLYIAAKYNNFSIAIVFF